MKYTEPKISITEFSCENIITVSTNDPGAQSVFGAAGVDDITVSGAVNVGEILKTTE